MLAIAGIITHYYPRGETASLLRWGPLCGIAGTAADVAASLFFYYQTTTLATTFVMQLMLSTYIVVLIMGIPLYIEYLKEGALVVAERVTQTALSGRLSAALTRHIEDIEVSIDQMRKRIRRDLTLLTVALPIIFLGTFLVVFSITGNPHLRTLLITTVYAGVGVFFLIIAAVFSSMLKKPRFVVLSVNHSDVDFDSIAAAEGRTLVKATRKCNLRQYSPQIRLQPSNSRIMDGPIYPE